MAHSSVAFPILLSYLPLFVSFVLFLIWNQGIVLGASFPCQAHRKATKATTLPESIYHSFYIVERSLRLSAALAKRPRWESFSHSFLFLYIIIRKAPLSTEVNHIDCCDRIEHPFLISDNRHFVFYIWRRTIKRHYLAKYLAVPIYYVCGWLVLTTLSYSQSVLFVLGFVVSTALTIVPSPLLEFRYFVLPYLFWRLHLSPAIVDNARWRGILEYLGYETINLITLWIFMSKPFVWDSEPGIIQRFIW